MRPSSSAMRIDISRREFALLAGTAGMIPLTTLDAAEALTAQAIVQRIQASLGGEWPAAGPDGFKAGDPSTRVKGIATTAMATMDVLKRAVKAGTNLVLTFEPTFYSRADGQAPTGPAGRGGQVAPLSVPDPLLEAKRAFIEKNGLVIYRLRDHWQARKESDMVTALAAALGWSAQRIKSDSSLYEIPQATAEQTVNLIRRKLNLRAGLRVVGDRKASIRRVLLYPGSMSTATMWQRYTEADMIVAGEVREWENTHFAADLFTAGEKRALVTTGRVVSEEPGMRACADWLRTVVRDVPAKWIGVGDPYWRPA